MRENLTKIPAVLTVIIALLLSVLFIAALRGTGMLLALIPGVLNWNYYLFHFVSEIVPLVLFLVLVIVFGYKFIFKQNRLGWMRSFYRAGFFTVYCCNSIVSALYMSSMERSGGGITVVDFIFYVLAIAMVGVTEELVYRGAILNLLVDKFPKTRGGLRAAIIVDGVIFGAMHMSNAIGGGISIETAALQSFSAGLLGILFAYVYLRTRNFWLVALYHFLIDFASLFASGTTEGGDVASSLNGTVGAFPWWLLLLVYCLLFIPICILVRKPNLDRILAEEQADCCLDSAADAKGLGITSIILGAIGIQSCLSGNFIGMGVLAVLAGFMGKKLNPAVKTAKVGRILGFVAIGLSAFMIIMMIMVYRTVNLEDVYGSLRELGRFHR